MTATCVSLPGVATGAWCGVIRETVPPLAGERQVTIDFPPIIMWLLARGALDLVGWVSMQSEIIQDARLIRAEVDILSAAVSVDPPSGRSP